MALPNPSYIDQDALHQASVVRLMNYAAVVGQEGVLGNDHLAVRELGTPAGSVQVMPGGYSVLAKHLGGEYEAYVGKFSTAEQVTVSPTSSAGWRHDLVILRVENPYVSGSGSWSVPVDAAGGPYAHIRVIENVPANTNSVRAVSPGGSTWSAITLARISRPASTGVVTQAHITNLRSLAELGGTRTVIIENPPATPPPIASAVWSNTAKGEGAGTELSSGSWTDWPGEATWQLAVPDWAREADVLAVFNPGTRGHAWSEVRLWLDGATTSATLIDENMSPDGILNVYHPTLSIGGAIDIPSGARGKVVTVKSQARKLGGANLTSYASTFSLFINFKRNPS